MSGKTNILRQCNVRSSDVPFDRQLLAYAEGGKYQPKDLKLDDFVIETLLILQHNLSPAVRVETHFQKDISFINADNAQMQLVLSAILANSNEAIEDEGLIGITAENKDVDDDFAKQLSGLKPGPMSVSLSKMTVRAWMRKQEAEYLNPFSQQNFKAVEWGWLLCMELSGIMMGGSLWTLNRAKGLPSGSISLPLR